LNYLNESKTPFELIKNSQDYLFIFAIYTEVQTVTVTRYSMTGSEIKIFRRGPLQLISRIQAIFIISCVVFYVKCLNLTNYLNQSEYNIDSYRYIFFIINISHLYTAKVEQRLHLK